MTAANKLRRDIILLACDKYKLEDLQDDAEVDRIYIGMQEDDPAICGEDDDEDSFVGSDCLQDARSELRHSFHQESGIECDWSRHYDSKSVAYQTNDGSWVGFTFWSGGGKHGEPDAIGWIEDAYDLKIIGEKHIIKYEFEKV